MATRSLVAIGKVAKAFGLRGDVVILPMTENLARFKKLKQVYVGSSDADAVAMRIATVHVEQRGVRLQFTDAGDRTAAEKFIGSLLFVEERDAVRLPKGTFFVHDMIGLRVVGEHGETIGVVKDVLKYPANEIYVIDHNGTEFLIPAVKEFIRKIDLADRSMSVKLIDGMLDDGTADDEENDED